MTKSKDKRLMHPVRYDFDFKEMRDLGQELGRANAKVYELKDQKKTTNLDLGAQIKVAEQEAAVLTVKVNNGHEYRDMECIAVFDTPRKGHKQIVRADTGEIVEEDKLMTSEEMQQTLEFE